MLRAAPLLCLVLLLSGCTDPALPEADDAAPAPAVPAPPPADGAYRPNVWLLEAPRPAGTLVSSGAEPSILASRDGSTLWIGDTSGLSISTDNGTTWRTGADPFSLSADGWALAEDDAGHLYLSTTTVPSVTIARSSDGGHTTDHVNQLVDVAPIADRPWLAARGDGEVALFMYDFGRSNSETCVRSTDGGETWLDRGLLTASPQGGGAVFDDAGNIYIGEDNGRLWRFPGTCLSAASKEMFPGGLGTNNMNKVDHDDGRFYMAASGPGNREVLLSGIKSWNGQPRLLSVSPPVLQSNAFATVSAHDGQVAVAWYGSETRGDPSAAGFGGAFNVFVAVVDDFWGMPTVRHVRLTDEPNHVGDICMGGVGCDGSADRDLLDYFMADHDVWGGLHVAYGHDGTGSDAVVRYAHVPPMPARPSTDAPTEGVPGDLPPVLSMEVREHDNRVRVDASASSDPEGGTLQFVWDWGDGSPVSTGPTAFHEYASFGVQTINLTATDAAGNVAHLDRRDVIGDERSGAEPHAGFSFSPRDPEAGRVVEFRDRTVDDEDDVVSWSWRFGDGARSSEPNPVHVFDAAGTYAVELSVVDAWGMRSTRASAVAVHPAPEPDADLGAPVEESPGPSVLLLTALVLAAAAMLRRHRP